MGRVTIRHRGGGHKRYYRLIDFKRDKIGMPPKWPRSNTIRTAPRGSPCLHYKDGEKRYILRRSA